VSQHHKGKTNLDFTGARDSEWQWHQLGHRFLKYFFYSGLVFPYFSLLCGDVNRDYVLILILYCVILILILYCTTTYYYVLFH